MVDQHDDTVAQGESDEPLRELLPRHAAGDRAAFPEFVQHFQGRVYSYLWRCGVAAHACDDLFQEIFLALHRSAGRYSPERSLSIWVFTVAVNKVRDFMRRGRVEGKKMQIAPSELRNGPSTPQQDLEQTDTAAWLTKRISELPFEERELINLCCVRGLPQDEAASILGVPLNTLKTKLRRLRAKLADELSRRGRNDPGEVLP